MSESVLVPLLDAIWKNEARKETDFDKILTRVVKTDRDETHKLDGPSKMDLFRTQTYMLSAKIFPVAGRTTFPGRATGACYWGCFLARY